MFIGYLFLVTVPYKGIDVLPDFIGYLLMIYACVKLSPYGKNFKYALWMLYPLVSAGLLITGFEIYNVFTDYSEEFMLMNIELISTVFNMAYHYFLLSALADLSFEVGRKKLSRSCRSVALISFVYFATIIIINAFFINVTFVDPWAKIILLSWYVIFVLTASRIFSCYMWICYEGDEDMQYKEGKIDKFINKHTRNTDKK